MLFTAEIFYISVATALCTSQPSHVFCHRRKSRTLLKVLLGITGTSDTVLTSSASTDVTTNIVIFDSLSRIDRTPLSLEAYVRAMFFPSYLRFLYYHSCFYPSSLCHSEFSVILSSGFFFFFQLGELFSLFCFV